MRVTSQPFLDFYGPFYRDRGLGENGKKTISRRLDDLTCPVTRNDFRKQRVVFFSKLLEFLLVGLRGDALLQSGRAAHVIEEDDNDRGIILVFNHGWDYSIYPDRLACERLQWETQSEMVSSIRLTKISPTAQAAAHADQFPHPSPRALLQKL